MSTKEKVILGVIGLLIVLIPTTSYFIAKNRTQTNAGAFDFKKTNPLPVTSPKEVPKTNALNKLSEGLSGQEDPSPSPEDDNGPTENTVAPLLGTTLNFKLIIEARPADKQKAKVFVGLAAGDPTNSPKYLLSFVVNVPDSGVYQGLSLAGLDQGSTYTAYLKGPAQIATASAFVVNPTPVNLGTLNMTTGDVNEDNLIDINDFNIVKGALGLTTTSPNWNANLDFNQDGHINSLDLAIVSRNQNKTGASGPWYSKSPINNAVEATESATPSGSLQNVGGKESSVGGELQDLENVPPTTNDSGHWFWIPGI